MLQIITLHGDYQYQIVQLFIINSTKGTKLFNNFCGIKYFTLKIANNKMTD